MGIKDYDMFGHSVVLNFNQKGEQHKTFIGGIVSILLNILIYGYGGYKSWQLYDKQGNTLTSRQSPTNVTALGEKTYEDMQILPYV